MAFDLHADGAWISAGTRLLYRWIPPRVPYGVVAPWPGMGRFDCGPPTLYFSHSPEGALAEYFRRHPELLPYQERLKATLFQIGLTAMDVGLDVSERHLALAVGVPWDRLRSNDLRASKRYAECQGLASDVNAKGGCTIVYPSAAYEGETNLVTLGDEGSGWTTAPPVEVADRPLVDPDMVRALPIGADL